jgi:hypothetical protein
MIYVDLLIIICYFPSRESTTWERVFSWGSLSKSPGDVILKDLLGCRVDLWGYNGGLTDLTIKTLGKFMG